MKDRLPLGGTTEGEGSCDELTQLAREFFSEEETPEEVAERRSWEKLSMEVLASDD